MSNVNPDGRVATALNQFALEYYMCARAAFLSGCLFSAGNLFHHAVEMLLKGQLAKTKTLDDLKDDYGHNLTKLWADFKSYFRSKQLEAFDKLVIELHRFQEIRYPDKMLSNGVSIAHVGGRKRQPAMTIAPAQPQPVYQLSLSEMDAFLARLFPLVGINPKAYFSFLSLEGRRLLTLENSESMDWLRDSS